MTRLLLLLLLPLAALAADEEPRLSVAATREGEIRIVARGSAPAFLELSLHPPGAPDQGLERRMLLPTGSETLNLRPPEGGRYDYSVRLLELDFGPPVPVAGRGTGPGRVRDPSFLAVSKDGDVYLSDRANRRVQVLTPSGRYRLSFGQSELGGRSASQPGGVDLSPNGRVLVVDSRGGRLLRYSRQGRPLGEADLERPLRRPGGLAVVRDQEYLLALPREDKVLLLNAQGRVRRELGGFGTASARLRGPEDVAASSQESFWVSESGNARIQHMQLGGGSLVTHAGTLKRPAGLGLGPRGLVHVVDRGTRAVHIFDPEIGELMVVARGTLGDPVDVAVAPSGDLFVADRRRSTLWRIPADPVIEYKTGQVLVDLSDEKMKPAPEPFAGPEGWMDLNPKKRQKRHLLPLVGAALLLSTGCSNRGEQSRSMSRYEPLPIEKIHELGKGETAPRPAPRETARAESPPPRRERTQRVVRADPPPRRSQVARAPEPPSRRRRKVAQAKPGTRRPPPKEAKFLHDLGWITGQNGKFEESIKFFRESIRKHKNYPEAWHGLALAYARNGNVEDAIPIFQQALELRQDFPEATFNLAVAYNRLGHRDLAQEKLVETLRMNPEHSRAHLSLGQLREQEGNIKGATRHYLAAIDSSPKLSAARTRLARIYHQQGLTDAAATEYEGLLKIVPDHEEGLFKLASIRQTQKRNQEAEALYKKVLKKNSRHAQALSNLGTMAKDRGQNRQALSYFERAFAVDQDNKYLQRQIGQLTTQLASLPAQTLTVGG